MAKPDKTAARGNGKKGGGNDDGGSSTPRGSKGDDIFHAGPGDQTFSGGDGTDTLVLSGSIWDYDWTHDGATRKIDTYVTDLNPEDGDTGVSSLSGVEILQFDDATIVLGEEQPLQLLTPPPAELVVTEGGSASFTFSFMDLDDNGLHAGVSMGWYSIGWGRLTTERSDDPEETRIGPNSGMATYTVTYDWLSGPYTRDQERLGEGERMVVPLELAIFTRNNDLDSLSDGDGVSETTRIAFDLVLVGTNDIPTISGDGDFHAVEGQENRFDLSYLGDDIDNDDTGATLRYDIVGLRFVGTGGDTDPVFAVTTEGSELVVTGEGLPYGFGSDETTDALVELRAVDSHGALSEDTVTVTVTIQGIDDTFHIPPFVHADGSFDFSDVPGDRLFDFGTDRVVGVLLDDAVLWPLLEYSDGDDVTMIRGSSMVWFNAANDVIIDDVVVYDETRFNTGAGDDVFIWQAAGTGQQYFYDNSIETGLGQDTVLLDMRGGSELRFYGAEIDTGGQSDYVGIRADTTGGTWFDPYILTGGGNDTVDIHYTNRQSGPEGDVRGQTTARLGTGDDRLSFVMDREGDVPLYQGVSLIVFADDGDDEIFVDVTGLGTSLAVPVTDKGSEIVANMYPGGFGASLSLGAGSDTVEFRLNNVAEGQTRGLIIDGDDYFQDASEDIDTVILSTVRSEQILSVAEATDPYGDYLDLTLDTGHLLRLRDIEVLTLQDTDNWFA